jgi:biotin operon repressor
MDYEKMTKAELIETIRDLEEKLARKKGDGRKEEVLALLKTAPHSIYEMAEKLDISNKNVSSQLCYLKKDGHRIATNADGQKFLESHDYAAPAETPSE